MTEYSDFAEFRKALDAIKLAAWAGEEVVSSTEVVKPAASPFLPPVATIQVQTVSGRILELTPAERMALQAPANLPIKYVGPKYDFAVQD